MDIETFNNKIKQGLEKLNKDQAVHFAWLCAVRALPFLGSNGNFNFWKKEFRQKYLYAIFYALDTNAAIKITTANKTVDSDSAYAANAARVSATITDTTATVTASASSAYAATMAARIAYGSSHHAYELGDNVIMAANTARNAAKATINNIDFEPIILQDLNHIQDRTGMKQSNYLDLYGTIWTSFQKALEAEGCIYWYKLYKEIFDNEFELDSKALEQRMNVPIEIRKQGAAVVANFLEVLEKEGAKPLNEARIIILGDKGAGKTCLAKRLIDPNAFMTTDSESTPGVDTALWKLAKENINIHIWDFAGHTVTHAVHQFFLSERCLYIIVYDGRTEERNRLEYWLNHMKNFGGDSKAIILVNKRDQHSVDIPINSLKEQYPIEDFYTFSVQDDKADLEDFRDKVADYIKNNPSWNNLKIPANYYKVKEELEEIFNNSKKGKGKEHITKEVFIKIAEKHKVDKIEELLTSLHALGVSLWYKDMEEFDTLVLNPEWISHGVYRIINWVNEEKKYSLTLEDFTLVFKENADRYPRDKHEFIFKLMIHYELAYETDKEKCLIIPHLLNEDRPAKLPNFPVGESLMLRYKAEQPLPPNTISRFIVRHYQDIKKEGEAYLVWRYGVVLEGDNDTVALVREENRTISVSAKGQNKTYYMSNLRETLNNIFNSYKSDKPELQYRIERFGQITEELETNNPLWLPDRKIYTHVTDKVPYYDDNTRQNIDLQRVAVVYNITSENLIIGGQGNQFLDKSIHNIFNFYNCNIDLQGNLNDLAQLLKENGKIEEAQELEKTAKELEKVEDSKKEEIKKKGIGNRLKRLAENLGDENSKLHKTVEGIKSGIDIAKAIVESCIDIVKWLG